MLEQAAKKAEFIPENFERQALPSLDTGLFANSILEEITGGSGGHHRSPSNNIYYQRPLSRLEHAMQMASIPVNEIDSFTATLEQALQNLSHAEIHTRLKGFVYVWGASFTAFAHRIINAESPTYLFCAGVCVLSVLSTYFGSSKDDRSREIGKTTENFKIRVGHLTDRYTEPELRDDCTSKISQNLDQITSKYQRAEKFSLYMGSTVATSICAFATFLFSTLPNIEFSASIFLVLFNQLAVYRLFHNGTMKSCKQRLEEIIEQR